MSLKLYDGYSGTYGLVPIALVSVSSVITTAAAFIASSYVGGAVERREEER